MEGGIRSMQAAVEAFAAGRMVIMVDDEGRENEGDLCIAAERVTPEAVNFMARHGRGLICLALTAAKAESLDLSPMVHNNQSRFGTAFTVSIEAREGVTTGISAFDRATTILAAVREGAKPADLVRPGHVFPLVARDGGVLVRAGQTEGSVDLARIAGLTPAAVICEVMKDDGSMARRPDLECFSAEHGIPIVSVAEIISHRMTFERLVRRVAEATLPTRHGGEMRILAYQSDLDGKEHIALVKGTVDDGAPVLVRVHSECLTGDVFGSGRCDCGEQLAGALEMIRQEGRGVLLYLRQEGRGIGITNKIRAYHLQENGADTVEANIRLGFAPDLRDYGVGAQILAELGLRKLRLITNNPKKIIGLEGYGMEIADRVPIVVAPRSTNTDYLRTKRDKMGHLIDSLDGPDERGEG